MAPSLVAATGAVVTVPVIVPVLTYNQPTGVTTGDVLVMVSWVLGTNSVAAAPAGFTQQATGGTASPWEVWLKVAGGSEPSTYAFTYSGASDNPATGALFCLRGIVLKPSPSGSRFWNLISESEFASQPSWTVPSQTSDVVGDFILTCVFNSSGDMASASFSGGSAITISGGDSIQIARVGAVYDTATSPVQVINDGPVTWSGNSDTGSTLSAMFYAPWFAGEDDGPVARPAIAKSSRRLPWHRALSDDDKLVATVPQFEEDAPPITRPRSIPPRTSIAAMYTVDSSDWFTFVFLDEDPVLLRYRPVVKVPRFMYGLTDSGDWIPGSTITTHMPSFVNPGIAAGASHMTSFANPGAVHPHESSFDNPASDIDTHMGSFDNPTRS